VLAPEQLGVPPLVVEQKEEQMPAPTRRQVLPGSQSLATAQASPGFAVPALAHNEPV
jgi:hypothetical protein